MSGLGISELVLILACIFLFALVFLLIPYIRIFGKAGFSPALGILMVVPLVNLVMLYYLAFAEWPALKKNPQ